MIIGIAGRAGAGKTTLAKQLRDLPIPSKSPFVVVHLADALKNLYSSVTGLDRQQIEKYKNDPDYRPFDGLTVREGLIALGKVYRDIYLNHWIDQVEPRFNIIVPDVRYQNEVDWVLRTGKMLWVEGGARPNGIELHGSEDLKFDMNTMLWIDNTDKQPFNLETICAYLSQ